MRPRIMIIDDEASICKALHDFLEDFDEFDLRTEHSAEGALTELGRLSADVCIVDLRLPGMNGVELVRRLVTENLCPRNIVHTASHDFELTCELRSLGVTQDDILRKPSWNMSILHRIRTLLGYSKERDGFPRHE